MNGKTYCYVSNKEVVLNGAGVYLYNIQLRKIIISDLDLGLFHEVAVVVVVAAVVVELVVVDGSKQDTPVHPPSSPHPLVGFGFLLDVKYLYSRS